MWLEHWLIFGTLRVTLPSPETKLSTSKNIGASLELETQESVYECDLDSPCHVSQ